MVERAHVMSPHDTWGAAGGAEHKARGQLPPLPPRWRRPCHAFYIRCHFASSYQIW